MTELAELVASNPRGREWIHTTAECRRIHYGDKFVRVELCDGDEAFIEGPAHIYGMKLSTLRQQDGPFHASLWRDAADATMPIFTASGGGCGGGEWPFPTLVAVNAGGRVRITTQGGGGLIELGVRWGDQ